MHRNVSFTNRSLALSAFAVALLCVSSVGCGSSSPGGATCTTLAEAEAVFNKATCPTCHDSTGSYAGFKMAGTGWETHLVGVNPMGGGTTYPSVCTASDGPYLIMGSNPADGLFIRKITGMGNLCAGGMRMPFGLPALSASDIQCVKDWATTLTHP